MEPKKDSLDAGVYKQYKKVPSRVILDQEVISYLDNKHSNYFIQHNEYLRKQLGDLFNTPLSAERVIRKYFKNLSLTPELLQNKSALYLGSAGSMFDEYCEKKYGTSFVSLDIDKESLGLEHPLAVVADARSLPFSENTFDLVISQASMPHILVPSSDDGKINPINIEGDIKEQATIDVTKVFAEAYRVLKPGGEIRFTTFSEKEMENYVVESDKEMKNLEQHLSRITLIKRALEDFKDKTGALCTFLDKKEGGLIVIIKPKDYSVH